MPLNVECDIKLIDLLDNMEKWSNSTVPILVGTVKIKKVVSLEPMTENLVWGKLQSTHDILAGSAVTLKPSCIKSWPRSMLIRKTVASRTMSFLGIVVYYQQFTEDFSAVAQHCSILLLQERFHVENESVKCVRESCPLWIGLRNAVKVFAN